MDCIPEGYRMNQPKYCGSNKSNTMNEFYNPNTCLEKKNKYGKMKFEENYFYYCKSNTNLLRIKTFYRERATHLNDIDYLL